MANKRPKRKQKSFSEAIGIRHIFGNETTDFFFGLVLFALAIVMAIAMGSFLTTGEADQSILENMRPGEWLNQDRQFTNYCGSIGAIVSYFLISVNFGLPAFLIPAFIMLVALKLMHAYSVNLWKWFLGMALVMVWASVTLAKFLTPIMGNLSFNPGGNHGLLCVRTMENIIGPPGLTATLLIVALAFLTYLSTETIEIVRKTLNPVKYITDKVKFTVTNHTTKETDPNVTDSQDGDLTVETPSEEEIDATVVDLTDMSQGQPSQPSHTPTEPITPTVQISEDDTDKLTVDDVKQEDKALGKSLGETIDLNTPINPWEPFTRYKFPSCDLLKKYNNKPVIDMDEIKANNARIVEVLNSFGVKISKINATVGPTVTLYEITPAEGVRIARIRGLEDDIALSLAALGIRIIAPIPGKGTIGIEVPNKNPQIVSIESVLNTKKFQTTKMILPMALGKTITNEVYMVDLVKIPHLLVAGATGQGKSVGLNAIISSLLYKKHPNELKFVLVDPKKVEFSI